MFKILREIASNLHSDDCKMYRTYKIPTPPRSPATVKRTLISSTQSLKATPFSHHARCPLVFFWSRLLSLVLQGVDVSADLECWSQLDVHAGHEVVLGQQQQGLSVDLLQPEGLGHIAAACGGSGVSKVRTEESFFAAFVYYLNISIIFHFSSSLFY